jgi:hypothetical protein
MNNFEINEQLHRISSNLGVVEFLYLSKDTKAHLEEGMLRDLSGEGLVVKTMVIDPNSLNHDELSQKLDKITKLAEQCRLGGIQADNTFLVHENFAKPLMGMGVQTIVIKNKESGAAETRQVTVKSISGNTYDVMLKSIHKLAASLERLTMKDDEKENSIPAQETQSPKLDVKSKHPTASISNQVKQMEKRLNEISTGQGPETQEARKKEEAEKKEQLRQEKQQAYIRKENLKYDLNQENIQIKEK